jgi:hypothetical protein
MIDSGWRKQDGERCSFSLFVAVVVEIKLCTLAGIEEFE